MFLTLALAMNAEALSVVAAWFVAVAPCVAVGVLSVGAEGAGNA